MVVAQHVVMMSGPVYNQGADFMRRAKKKLDEMNISCLSVVDDEKKLQGIITVTDVMRGLLAACTLTAKSAE